MKPSFGAIATPHVHNEIIQIQDPIPEQILAMAKTLVSMIGFRDHYTASHSARVARYVRNIATQLVLPDTETETLVSAASLHDIGKAGISDQILLKPGKLT